jgi:cyanophycin synthetase
MNGVRPPGSRIMLGLAAVGDRTDELIESLAEIAARDADVVVIAHKANYMRGRSLEDLEQHFLAGAARVGVHHLASYPSEVAAMGALVAQAKPGDVVGMMVHDDRQGCYDWLEEHGATIDDPATLRDKVRAATAP